MMMAVIGIGPMTNGPLGLHHIPETQEAMETTTAMTMAMMMVVMVVVAGPAPAVPAGC